MESVPAAGAAMIEAQSLGHTYKGGQVALDGVDLALGTGLYGLLGPNGAGKSTLMRIICTLLVPSRGTAKVCGHDVTSERRQVREQIGYLPQEFGAWRNHRAEEVLDTLARLSGLSDKRERRRRVAETLELVGLDAVADRKVKKLSGGMVRRLGVAQAMVHEPRVLIVDEPTVGLDPEERMRFRQVMARLGRDRTILLSTHIVADLGGGCSEIALLDGGRIEFQGAPDELLRRAVGRVFEVTVDAPAAQRLESQYEIVSRTASADGVTLRGVTGNGLPEDAAPVPAPTLEEGYLAFMAARGRTDAAREGQEQASDAPAAAEDDA